MGNNIEKERSKSPRKFNFEFTPTKINPKIKKNSNLNESSISYNKFFISTFNQKNCQTKKIENKSICDFLEESDFCKEFLFSYNNINIIQGLNQPSNFYVKDKEDFVEEKIHESNRIEILRKKLFKKNNLDRSLSIDKKLLKKDFDFNLEKLNKQSQEINKKSEFTFRKLKKISQISGYSNEKNNKKEKSFNKEINRNNNNKISYCKNDLPISPVKEIKKNGFDKNKNNFISLKERKKNKIYEEKKKQESLEKKINLKIKETENLEDTLIRASLENKKKRENFFKQNSRIESDYNSHSSKDDVILENPKSSTKTKSLQKKTFSKKEDSPQTPLKIPKANFINLLKKQKTMNSILKNKNKNSFFESLLQQNKEKFATKKNNDKSELNNYNPNHLTMTGINIKRSDSNSKNNLGSKINDYDSTNQSSSKDLNQFLSKGITNDNKRIIFNPNNCFVKYNK